MLEVRAVFLQRALYNFTTKLRTRVSSSHHFPARTFQNRIMNLITNAQRGPAITSRRLNEHALERRVQQNLSVQHRVVRDATGEPEIRHTSLLVQMIQDMKPNFFES